MSLGVTCGCCVPDECQGQASPSLNKSGRVPAFVGIPSDAPPVTPSCIALSTVTFTYEDQQENEITVTLIDEAVDGFILAEIVFSSGEQTIAVSLTAPTPNECYEVIEIQGVKDGELQTFYAINNATS